MYSLPILYMHLRPFPHKNNSLLELHLNMAAGFVIHLAKSLATVSLGQVTKAAECVPEVYVSDAMENALSPTVLNSWNINTLRSTVCQEETQNS